MRIGIDARMLAHSGIGTYVGGLLAALGRDPGPHDYVVFTAPELAARIPSPFETRLVRVPVYGLREQLGWRGTLEAARCDVVHVPHYNVPLAYRRPLVVTVHDLIHLLFPRFLSTPLHAAWVRALLGGAVRRARVVLADSACTRDDLVRRLGCDPDRIRVAYPGVGATFGPRAPDEVEAFRARHELAAKFVLYVGLRRPHKNLERLVRAWAAWQGRAPGPEQLVLWGRRDRRDEATERAIGALGIGGSVRSVEQRLVDEEMPLLYASAQAVVLPSLYEGFGLPALEAMACGVPVLAARAAALPEVVGDSALLADPLDVEALAAGLERITRDEALRTALARRGPGRARNFTWGRTAALARAAYEAAA